MEKTVNRKTLFLIIGIVLVALCIGLIMSISAMVWANQIGNQMSTQFASGQCPPIIFFEDTNGNSQQDTGEISFAAASANLNGGSITFYDSANKKIGDYSFGCFMPPNASGTMSLEVNMPKGYKATTTTRHSFQVIYAMDTVIYIGVQKVP